DEKNALNNTLLGADLSLHFRAVCNCIYGRGRPACLPRWLAVNLIRGRHAGLPLHRSATRSSPLFFPPPSSAGPVAELAAMGWAAAQLYGGRERPGRNLAGQRPQTVMEP